MRLELLRGFAAAWLLVGFAVTLAIADEPRPSPSTLLPAAGLHFYLEFDGLDRHEAAWKASAAYDILARTTTGSTLLEVEQRTLDRALAQLKFPDGKPGGAKFVAMQEHLVARGFALATYAEDGETSTVYVLNGLGDEVGLARFETLLRGFLRTAADNLPLPGPTPLRGREIRGFGGGNRPQVAAEAPENPLEFPPSLLGPNGPPTSLSWWREGASLIVVDGPRLKPLAVLSAPDRAKKDFGAIHRARVEAVLDSVEARRPSVATHPAYRVATLEGLDIAGFKPTGLLFAEAKQGQGVLRAVGESRNPGAPIGEFAFFEAMDLSRAERIVGRWGFRGKSLATDLRFSYPDAWKGPLNPPGFAKDRLPPIPRVSGLFAIGSLDLTRAAERFGPLEGALIPEARAFVAAATQALVEASTPELRGDLLRHLGPVWSVYAGPGSGDDSKVLTLPAFLIEFDEAEGLEKSLGALASGINGYFRAKLEDPGDANRPALAFERLLPPDRGYRLVSLGGLIPWLADAVQPTLLIGRSHLVAAPSLALARAAVVAESNREGGWRPTGEVARSIESLPAKLAFLSVGNPKDSGWPEALAGFRESAPNFVARFLQMPIAGTGENPPDLLEILGVPRQRRTSGPRARELAASIHSSVLAVAIDDRSFRLITLEALPLGCLGFETVWSPQGAMNIQLKSFAPGR